MSVEVRPLSDVMGAEIIGADMAAGIDEATFGIILDAFHSYQVVCLRAQEIRPEDQIAFSARFGEVEPHTNDSFHLDGYPEVLVLSNEQEEGQPIGVLSAGDFWHTDYSFKKRTGLATLLYAIRLPSQGGDTEFADMYAAYDSLPDATKDRIAGLRAVHSRNRMRNPRVAVTRPNAEGHYAKAGGPENDVTHPIVRTHPETGRKGLYVSPRFTIGIEGMDDAEAQPLLDDLFARQVLQENRYRHKWRPGDFLFWDNRCVNHRACGGYAYPDIRLIHRTTTIGDEPF